MEGELEKEAIRDNIEEDADREKGHLSSDISQTYHNFHQQKLEIGFFFQHVHLLVDVEQQADCEVPGYLVEGPLEVDHEAQVRVDHRN